MQRRDFLKFAGIGLAVPASTAAAVMAQPCEQTACDPQLKAVLEKVHADHTYKMTPEEFQTVLSYTSTSAFVASHLLARTEAHCELSDGKRAIYPRWCIDGLSRALSKMIKPMAEDRADGLEYDLSFKK